MIKIEICINGDAPVMAGRFAAASFRGGADTIELCSAMESEGLTPSRESVQAARRAFPRPGLMVMARPRDGDFHYSGDEIEAMLESIEMAASEKADGVVFGALDQSGHVDKEGLNRLMGRSRALGLKTTFHRAFDALADPLASVEELVDAGIDRILSSGIRWGQKGSALDGVDTLNRLAERIDGRIELVVGGGVNPQNAPRIVESFVCRSGPLALHAYSGAQELGETTESAVDRLVQSANSDRF